MKIKNEIQLQSILGSISKDNFDQSSEFFNYLYSERSYEDDICSSISLMESIRPKNANMIAQLLLKAFSCENNHDESYNKKIINFLIKSNNGLITRFIYNSEYQNDIMEYSDQKLVKLYLLDKLSQKEFNKRKFQIANEFRNFAKIKSSLENNEYTFWMDNLYPKNSIEYDIFNDDSVSLKARIEKDPKIIHKTINKSNIVDTLYPKMNYKWDISMLNFAAKCGSKNCFDLILKKIEDGDCVEEKVAKPKALIKISHVKSKNNVPEINWAETVNYSIEGQNKDIFEICRKKAGDTFNYKDALRSAISSHNNSLFLELATNIGNNIKFFPDVLDVIESMNVFVLKHYIDVLKLDMDVFFNGQGPVMPFQLLCSKGLPAAVEYILTKFEVNLPEIFGTVTNPLNWSCGFGWIKTSEVLIKHNCRMDVDEGIRGPLHAAASQGFVDSCRILVNNGANIESIDKKGDTPLMKAVLYEELETVKFLLGVGAKINVRNKNGETPLHIAAKNQNKDIVEFLVKNGACVSVKDNNGNTPLALVENCESLYDNRANVMEILGGYKD